MVAISQHGTVPTFDVSMAVTFEVTAPFEATPEAPPRSNSVMVTAPQTDEVRVPTGAEAVDCAGKVPRAAIGEVVAAAFYGGWGRLPR